MDHREAEAVERRDERQQHRVGVRRDQPDRDVGSDDERGQPAAVRDDVGRHLALDAEADGGVGADADREREDEQEELGAPAPPVHEPHEGAGLGHGSALSRGSLRRSSEAALPAVSGSLPGGEVDDRLARRRRGCRRRCPRATLPASKSVEPVELRRWCVS